MRLHERLLKQKAVYWAPESGADDYGNKTYGSATEVKVRWETGRRNSSSPTADTIAWDATVDVDQELEVHGRMRLGALVDLPDTLDNLYKIVDYQEVPDIRGKNPQRTVLLMRI